jgi:hypothetical protein
MITHMKTLMCSLAAVLSVALGSGTLAVAEEEQQMSGTVVEYHPGFLTIENSKKERVEFHAELGDQRYRPKVGDKVTVHYEINSRGWWFTYKVDKAGKAEKGSKEH